MRDSLEDRNRYAFVIFKPDAVQQNQEYAIWGFLEERGIKLLQQKVGYITREKRKELYRDFHVASRTNWDLGTEFYELGPALFLWICGEFPSPYKSLGEYISSELKGHFVPFLAKPDTIRSEFNSINPVFNLIHSSDDGQESARESLIFFTEEELADLTPKSLDLSWKVSTVPFKYDFVTLLFDVKRKVAEQTLQEMEHEREVFLEWVSRNSRFLAEVTERERRHQLLLAKLEEENNWLVDHVQEDHLLRRLTRFCDFQQLDYDALFQDLEALNICLDRWERYLLKSSMYYITFR